ncbi:MAG: Flp1 family type IVb pilin [Coprococcus eutactus]
MRCKGRVFRDTGQGAKITVVLIAMCIVFKQQITSLVNNIWNSINKNAKKIY